MFKDADNLIQDALELPAEERLRVAERLFESIPEEAIADAWLAEVEKRKAAWDAGLVTGIEVGKSVSEKIDELIEQTPREERAKLPTDGSANLDHYSSEGALADWNRPEEDDAWAYLQNSRRP